MTRALALAGALALSTCGCSSTVLQVRCDPPVEFASASVVADADFVVTSAEVLACGLPVGVSVAVATDGETVTLCVEPPGTAAVCTVVEP